MIGTAWLKALLPKSAMIVEEKAWNVYPYTKTRYTCPLIEKFSIEIETLYFNDCGNQPNVFKLTSSELNRQIDIIDIVKECPSEFKSEEDDPRLYKSKKTQRGPLPEDWVEQYWNNGQPIHPIMCAYKLCKVEFKYWGMQSKIEKFIHDIGKLKFAFLKCSSFYTFTALRGIMVKAHQQAWVWQDEWVELTMDDIRKLEQETQEYLKRRMANSSNENIPKSFEEEEEDKEQASLKASSQVVDYNVIDKDNDNFVVPLTLDVIKGKKHSISQYTFTNESEANEPDNERSSLNRKRSSLVHGPWSRNNSRSTIHSPNDCQDVISTWRMQSLAKDLDSSSDDDEFYDAEDVDDTQDNINSLQSDYFSAVNFDSESDNIFSTKFMHKVQSDIIYSSNKMSKSDANLTIHSSSSSPDSHQTNLCPINTLMIVLHGGNVLDVGNEVTSSKLLDINTFHSTLNSVIGQHYTHLTNRIAVRLVPCPPICLDSLLVLSSLSPYGVQSNSPTTGTSGHKFESISVGALPLFAVSSDEYQDHVMNVITLCNKVYSEFISSDVGKGFCGRVVMIGDSVGAIVGFDALCYNSPPANVSASQSSLPETHDNLKMSNPVISINDSLSSSDSNTNTRNAKAQVYCKSLSHPGTMDSVPPDVSNRLLISSDIRRRSSGSSDLSSIKFDFEINDFFMFGSLVGVVLTFRKMLNLEDKFCKYTWFIVQDQILKFFSFSFETFVQ